MFDLSLRKFLAPEFIFGVDARKLAGRYVRNFGARKVLVVTDPGVLSAGWAAEVIRTLEEEKVSYELFTGVSPNPRDYEVMTGAEAYRQGKCDSLVAVGGGSVVDCAKGIGIVCSNNKHILSFEGVDKVPLPIPPLVCIPTTAGASADVSQFAIINNTTDKVKIAIISKSVVPDVSLVDPATLVTMDSMLTACTGIDALVHAIEAFVSNANSAFTDMYAQEAIRLIDQNLLHTIQQPDNLEYRGKVMMGSLNAGLAFSNASLGCVHAMAHSLGGFLDLPHGECNAMLLPHVVNFNYEASSEKYDSIALALNLPLHGLTSSQRKKALVERLLSLKNASGINKTLKERGVIISDINELARKAMKDPCNATNPRRPSQSDLEVIFKEAM
ncbi:MAG: alcohol dehydrogenase-like regulatory protein ErcA [Bacteroidota bacterium]|nr:alcohol dehydrogenase-like regulatory protein ErcA [Bacteroidota bacterium]